MRVFQRSKFQRHIVIPLMLVCFMSACHKWSVQPAHPTLHEAPERARITLDDGRVVELRSLEIRGDSVVGFAKTDASRFREAAVWGDTLQTYPLADVTRFEVRKTDTGKTVLAVALSVALAVALTAAALSSFEIGPVLSGAR